MQHVIVCLNLIYFGATHTDILIYGGHNIYVALHVVLSLLMVFSSISFGKNICKKAMSGT